MDALDLAFLRELSRHRIYWWGGLDPRVSTETIARRLRVAGSTIRSRLAAWERDGALLGFDVMPNPSLFGARLAGGSIRVHDARDRARVLDDLALVDGVRASMDHVGDWIAILVLSQTDRDLARTRQLLARLPGVAEVSPCIVYPGPVASMVPSPLDWRLLAELRATPRARVQEIAARMRISPRTFTRRYEALVRKNAVLSWPLFDFTRFPGPVGRLIVELADGVDATAVAAHVKATMPDAIELTPVHRDYPALGVLDLLVYHTSVPGIEDAALALRDAPGVESVETLFPRQFRAYGDWVDTRLATIVGAANGAASGVRAG